MNGRGRMAERTIVDRRMGSKDPKKHAPLDKSSDKSSERHSDKGDESIDDPETKETEELDREEALSGGQKDPYIELDDEFEPTMDLPQPETKGPGRPVRREKR